jgi:hypothetical protein
MRLGSVELLFSVGLDAAVAGGIGHTGQNETGLDLVVIQEALIGLIDGSRRDLAGAGAASTSTTGIGKVDSLFFSSVKDVLIVGNLDGLVEALALVDEGDLIGSHERG